jgi:hypothetical protein
MKQEKRISKYIEKYSGDWPPEDAAGFVAWFQRKLDDIPPESRAKARIEIDSEENYGSSKATIEFSYARMETDEEEAEREQQAAAQAERRRAQELRTLAELQAKYGRQAHYLKPNVRANSTAEAAESADGA